MFSRARTGLPEIWGTQNIGYKLSPCSPLGLLYIYSGLQTTFRHVHAFKHAQYDMPNAVRISNFRQMRSMTELWRERCLLLEVFIDCCILVPLCLTNLIMQWLGPWVQTPAWNVGEKHVFRFLSSRCGAGHPQLGRALRVESDAWMAQDGTRVQIFTDVISSNSIDQRRFARGPFKLCVLSGWPGCGALRPWGISLNF